MPVIKELVAVGEIKQPGADSVEAYLRASSEEISTDARRGLSGCFFAGFSLHS
jgi:hypothetical protein